MKTIEEKYISLLEEYHEKVKIENNTFIKSFNKLKSDYIELKNKSAIAITQRNEIIKLLLEQFDKQAYKDIFVSNLINIYKTEKNMDDIIYKILDLVEDAKSKDEL